jgi:hypothetical protein
VWTRIDDMLVLVSAVLMLLVWAALSFGPQYRG